MLRPGYVDAAWDGAGLRHDALVYADPETFVEATVPMLREGVLAGQSAFAAVAAPNLELIAAELGPLAARVRLVDAREWYRRPMTTLLEYHAYITSELDGGSPGVRIVGEPAWPDGPPELLAEWVRYESVLNEALAEMPVWARCPYDARALPQDVVRRSAWTHAAVVGDGAGDGAYLSVRELFAQLSDPVPPAPNDAVSSAFEVGDVSGVRGFLAGVATAAGMDAVRVAELCSAANEVATNAFVHGRAGVGVTAWVDADRLVCEIVDRGPGVVDVLGGWLPPDPRQVGGWGLWLARHLSDALEVRSRPGRTVVRISKRLTGGA